MPILGVILFKMNQIINKFLLTRDMFNPEMDYFLRTKNTKIHKKGDFRYICRNELEKACFQHDMVYGYLIGLP